MFGSEGWNFEITWLDDHMHSSILKISRQIELVTGMKVSDPYFVENKLDRIKPNFDLSFLSTELKVSLIL